jgi:hypothetical protein
MYFGKIWFGDFVARIAAFHSVFVRPLQHGHGILTLLFTDGKYIYGIRGDNACVGNLWLKDFDESLTTLLALHYICV